MGTDILSNALNDINGKKKKIKVMLKATRNRNVAS